MSVSFKKNLLFWTTPSYSCGTHQKIFLHTTVNLRSEDSLFILLSLSLSLSLSLVCVDQTIAVSLSNYMVLFLCIPLTNLLFKYLMRRVRVCVFEYDCIGRHHIKYVYSTDSPSLTYIH